MKHILIIIALLTTHATASNTKDLNYELCKVMSKTAKAIMTARQFGSDMSKILDSYNKAFASDEKTRVVVKSIIIESYSRTRYTSSDIKRLAIEEFEIETMVECLKNPF